jgi:hypothetical protein
LKWKFHRPSSLTAAVIRANAKRSIYTNGNLMKLLRSWIVALAFSGLYLIHPASSCAQERLPPVVEIDFPIGDINFRHDETLRGMMLTITSGKISMRARRVYVGDGKLAVKYEASQFGMLTPTGTTKRGAITVKNGARILADAERLTKWGSKSNEVYLLVPNIKLIAIDEETE